MNKQVKNIIIWSLIVIYIIVIFAFVTSKYKKVQCNNISIQILDSTENHLIQKDDVLKLIYKYSDGDIIGYSFEKINIEQLELKLNENSYFQHVEVYKTTKGVLQVDVRQRNPIIRIFNDSGQSFYIDKYGYVLPISENYTSYEIVATGNIKQKYSFNDEVPINIDSSNNIINDLFTLAKYINDDSFFLTQIEQIYVNQDNEFELVPRVGEQIILFGTIDNYQTKFRNLKEFYKRGMNKVGWASYKSINLKYEDQIVCAY